MCDYAAPHNNTVLSYFYTYLHSNKSISPCGYKCFNYKDENTFFISMTLCI